jgi:fermentation-respiration switch protein FrsA (DUF1100 family)
VNLVRILLLAAAGYAALLLVVFLARERLTFPIRGGGLADPALFGLSGGLIVRIPVGGGVELAGWWLPPDSAAPPAPALVWFHGNAETVQSLAPVLRLFRMHDAGLLAVDQRGYGASGGSPTAANTAADAEAVYDWLAARGDVDPARIVAYGRSVGSGPAARIARSRPVAGLILESAFTSLRAMARHHYPLFPSWLASGAFDNLEAVRESRSPLLVIHGTADDIVPPWMARALAAAAGERASIWEIGGAGHNDTYDIGDEVYVERVKEFVRNVTRGEMPPASSAPR